MGGLALFSLACASSPKVPVRVDLNPARSAIQDARNAGAARHAPDRLRKAQGYLRQAEALVKKSAPGSEPEVRRLADLAITEARSAAEIARLTVSMQRPGAAAPDQTNERTLAARLRRAEEEQRRLEDRIELLQRDLEVTETELIRSKARLKGNETKAEASAAVAEAQILASRLAQDRTKASILARTRESLAKAEEQIGLGNYGAAIFFALKAQDTATRSSQDPQR